MSIQRAALIFDRRLRPDTTGVYCLRALETLVETTHVSPNELDGLSPDAFDIYVNIDDGLRYRLPSRLKPAVWWAIDTHLDFEWYRAKAPDFDLVFAAQRDGADRLARENLADAHWLPLACDPKVHRRHSVEEQYDVSFVGHMFPGPRRDLTDLLKREFTRSFVGQAFFDEMARIYSASRIVFNRSLRNDINMRVFEALACGSLLMTNDLSSNAQAELFDDGVHLATYVEADDLIDRVRYYLGRPEERRRIASAGQREVLERHTYSHRMKTLLDVFERRHQLLLPGATFVDPDDAPTTRAPAWPVAYVDLVPEGARRVLCLACGDGTLGLRLKASLGIESVGVDDEPHLAAEAGKGHAELYRADPAKWLKGYQGIPFDAVIVGPRLTCSAALLDDLQEVLANNGSVVGRPVESISEPTGDLRQGRLVASTRHIASLTGATVETTESDDGQSLTLVRWRLENDPGLTSIVIVTFNQLAYTRLCVERLQETTSEMYELIVVDNGSSDGTVEYLNALDCAQTILNGDNRGFPAAANQGIRAAQGRQVVLLNNDCVVTTGWLQRLLAPLRSDRRIGLTGPCSNCVSGIQEVAVDYSDLDALEPFAQRWAVEHRGETQDTDRLVGFCLLFRREVVDQIGLLDERFGIGNFEDDDFCHRAIEAGYRALVVRDAFVHHFGHCTFRASGVDLNALLAENQQKYQEKWRARAADVEPHPAISGRLSCRLRDEGGLELYRRKPSISLCMIVRDSSRTLPACLESVRTWVDEMIVVDTGSIDDTVEIAERFGAKVYHFPWCDDFSAARNESLRHATGDWVFWVDSDDTVDEVNGQQLRALVESTPKNEQLMGYVMQVHCPGDGRDGDQDVTVVDHVKLFRNRKELRFEGRIHEQVLPSIRRLDGTVAWSDVFVVHSGSDHSVEGKTRKYERDLRILYQDLGERPEHPFVLFNLGMTYADMLDHETAVGYLLRSLAAAQPDESHVRKVYALLVGCLAQLDRCAEALETCEAGLELFPKDPELHFRAGVVAQQLGDAERAIRAYHAALRDEDERHFSSMDRGITGFKARHNLAIVYEEIGQWSDATSEWREVVREAPTYRPGWYGLIANLLQQGNLKEVEAAKESMPWEAALRSVRRYAAAESALRRGDRIAALEQITEGLDETPTDAVFLRFAGQFLFDEPQAALAEICLAQLTVVSPDDAAAWHNLGTVRMRLGNLDAADAAYRRALELRPDFAATHLYRGYALRQAGNVELARMAFHTAFELDPTNIEARQAALATEPSNRVVQDVRPLVKTPASKARRRLPMLRVGLVIPVLDSHEAVRRQILHLDRVLPPDWQVILLDDGSNPPIKPPMGTRLRLELVATNDSRAWTQGLARNLGARISKAPYLLMTDIDHIVSVEAIDAAHRFTGARMLFPRRYGVLDADGKLSTDFDVLRTYGLDDDSAAQGTPLDSIHQNTFLIRRDVFLRQMEGGYDTRLCSRGRYGGDDVEFNDRYRSLIAAGSVPPDARGPAIYVFPDPASDHVGLFHRLPRNEGAAV